MILIVLIILILQGVSSQEFLKDQPITFALRGTTTYVPSTGGVAIPGYSMTIGFNRFQWLGKDFIIQGLCS